MVNVALRMWIHTSRVLVIFSAPQAVVWCTRLKVVASLRPLRGAPLGSATSSDGSGPRRSLSHPPGRERRLHTDAILDSSKRTMHARDVDLVTIPRHRRGESASSRGHLLRRLFGLSWAYRWRV